MYRVSQPHPQLVIRKDRERAREEREGTGLRLCCVERKEGNPL